MAQIEQLFIAEKPSLAKEIAEARAEMLGVRASKADACWEVGPDRVTWFFGHMFELAEPASYGDQWAKWTVSSLPIVVPDGGWKLVCHDDKKDQIRKVRALVKSARAIVNCGDPDREGQLLIDEALLEMGTDPFGPDVKRLWMQSLTMRDKIAALSALQPNAQKRSLYDAAACRQRADWQHGMTFSRLYTLLARNGGSDTKISVGRVQTPTLRLVVDRDRERLRFKPVDHYLPRIVFRHEKGAFAASWVIPADHDGLDTEGRLVDRKAAEAIVAKIAGKRGKVAAFKSDPKSKPPPLPYSLAALQSEAGGRLGLSAQEVQDVAQALYEMKATTYPRTDCRYLPQKIRTDEAPGIMAALGHVDDLSGAVEAADMAIRTSAWDDSKITGHFGIIPTGEFSAGMLDRMSDVQRKVFMMVARNFVANFHPNFKWKATVADVACEGERFRATGRIVTDQGWKKVFGAGEADDEEDGDEESAQSVPQMGVGDPVDAENGSLVSKRTSPPPGFTDPTLILAMENVHRFVTNPEVKKRLKETDGIGTPATRAATIETLIKRKFLERPRGKKNALVSTELGRSIIDVLPEELRDPGLTAVWESALERVEKASLSPLEFMAAQARDITARVEAAKGTSVEVKGGRKLRAAEGHGVACAKCGLGTMVTREVFKGEHKGKVYLACSRAPECNHRAQPGVEPLPGEGKQCPECGKGQMFTRGGISAKTGKPYRMLSCDNYPECRHGEFPDRPTSADVPPLPGHGKECPACRKGRLLTKELTSKKDGQKYKLLSCDNYPECKHGEWPDRPPVAEPLPGEGKKCPECGKGQMRTKEGVSKAGKPYKMLSCDNYPACRHAEFPDRPAAAPVAEPLPGHGKKCPECGKGQMLTKEGVSKAGNPYKLLSCDNWRECKHGEFPDRQSGPAPEPLPGHGRKCGQCGKGTMRTKDIRGKDGKQHRALSCDAFPACRNTEFPDSGAPRQAGSRARA